MNTHTNPNPTIISISIDIAGSTEAKTRMLAIASDGNRVLELYKELYDRFLFHEDRFYRALFSSISGSGGALDWRHLFVVKGIGDELWVLYEIDPTTDDHIASASVRLMEAALWLVQEVIGWQGTEQTPDPNAPEEEINKRSDHMRLAYKVYLDIISDALEISGIRGEIVARNVQKYLGREGIGLDADAAELASRLNAGQFDLNGHSVRQTYRTDYVGHEVDRFFRMTKASLPGILTIGEALICRLKLVSKLVAYPGLFRATLEYPQDPFIRNAALINWSPDLLYVQRDIPAAELKGIGYPYRVYHFATRPQLNGLWQRCENDPIAKQILLAFPIELRDQLKTVAERTDDSSYPKPRSDQGPIAS